jgi:AcrR family transcriptional regulator
MKLYKNRAWLFDRYHVKKLDVGDIAKEAGCTIQTVYVYLRKFDII